MFNYKKKLFSLLSNNSWNEMFNIFLNNIEFQELLFNIFNAYNHSKYLYPKKELLLNAFNLTTLDNCKVIIFGQDPYYQKDVANGLAFSINKGKPISSSLKNIFNELYDDLKIFRTNTDLSDWAKQGVLLLNTILTVYEDKPLSCKTWKWNIFIKLFLEYMQKQNDKYIFVLLGNHAKKLKQYINTNKDFIIETSHPSGLSFHKGFKNSKIFSKINNILLKLNKETIKW